MGEGVRSVGVDVRSGWGCKERGCGCKEWVRGCVGEWRGRGGCCPFKGGRGQERCHGNGLTAVTGSDWRGSEVAGGSGNMAAAAAAAVLALRSAGGGAAALPGAAAPWAGRGTSSRRGAAPSQVRAGTGAPLAGGGPGRAGPLALRGWSAAPGLRRWPGLAGFSSPRCGLPGCLTYLPFLPRHGRRAVGGLGAAAMPEEEPLEESAWACPRRRSECVKRVRHPKPWFRYCCFYYTSRNKGRLVVITSSLVSFLLGKVESLVTTCVYTEVSFCRLQLGGFPCLLCLLWLLPLVLACTLLSRLELPSGKAKLWPECSLV